MYKKITFVIIIIIGLAVPFIPYLVFIEMFLLLPIVIIFVGTLIYLTVSVLNKNVDRRIAIFVFSLLPTFIISQLLLGFIVDRVQKFRCEKIIAEVEELKAKTGELPEDIKVPFGIKYIRMNDKENFLMSYSRGFMVTEKYESFNKQWRSYGWND